MWRRQGFYYLLTLTAPGSAEHFMPSGKRCPCTAVGGVDLPRWNASAGKLWNRLLTGIERRYSVRPAYFRSAEVQDRGAIHHHVLIHSPRKLHVRSLRPLAIAAGYGHEVDLKALEPGSRQAAIYVTKRVAGYVSKSADQRDRVPWWGVIVDQDSGEVYEGHTDATFRTWSQSRSWGTSMAAIRAVERGRFLERQVLDVDPPASTDSVLRSESPPAPS
jgi:hypothetical protein